MYNPSIVIEGTSSRRLRRLVCVGTLPPSAGDPNHSANLIALYNDSRVYNSEHAIKGVLLVAGSSCLLIHEGEAGAIGRVLYRLCRDERIRDIGVVLNCTIEAPKFSTWSIRCIRSDSDRHHGFMQRVRLLIGDGLRNPSPLDRQRLDEFFGAEAACLAAPPSTQPIPVRIEAQSDISSYRGKLLFLTGWPKPAQMKLSPQVMRVCSRLTAMPIVFDRLDAGSLCGSEQALLEILGALDRLGLLVRKNSDADAPIPGDAPPREMAPADRFSRVLRKFLATAKPESA